MQLQSHQLSIKQEVVDNATGQSTPQNINQSNPNPLVQNIATAGNGILHGHKGVTGHMAPTISSGNGQFVDSTTTTGSVATTHPVFQTNNNSGGVSRSSGSCDGSLGSGGGLGTSVNQLSNRDLFSLQEELLNGTQLLL